MVAATQSKPGLRERKRQQTRETIIRVGIELFAERGVKETTLSDIAAAANISPRSFFSHFRRKEDLLFEEQRQGAAALQELLETRGEGESTVDVLNRALAGFSAVLPPELLRLRKLRYKVIASEPRLQGPDHSEFADAIREPLLTSYSQDLRAHGVEQADSEARLLTGLTIGLVMELVYIARESVSRGTREEDTTKLEAIQRTVIQVLQNSFAVFAKPEATSH
jgi:AcrR family transcriptional regulator